MVEKEMGRGIVGLCPVMQVLPPYVLEKDLSIQIHLCSDIYLRKTVTKIKRSWIPAAEISH